MQRGVTVVARRGAPDPAGHRLVVVGSGSLARSVVWSLATVASSPVAVTVLARSADAAAELAYVANTRAALAGRPVTVSAGPLDAPDPADDPADRTASGRADRPPASGRADRPPSSVRADRPTASDPAKDLAGAIGAAEPDVVLVCASYQSPWERVDRPSAWTELVRRAGFGATLPLQAGLAVDVARATPPTALLLNACFPDAVNPLLAALDLPVHAGVGNAAIVAASLQAALGLPDQRELAVLAHHVHLHEPADPADEARAWLRGEPVEKLGPLLAEQRATEPREVNAVTGLATAVLLDAVLTGGELHTSLPGPHGLPGGYPVAVRGRELELRLPAGVDRDEAVAWNRRMADLDGVRVEDGRVVPSPAAAEALAPHLPDVASGFAVRDTPAVARALLDLRSRLRATPAVRPDRREHHRS